MLKWSEGKVLSSAPEQMGFYDKLRVLISGVAVPRPVNEGTPSAYGLDYEPHRVPNGRGDELDLWFLPGDDDGVVALLFTGYASSKGEPASPRAGLSRTRRECSAGRLLRCWRLSGSGTSLGILESHDVAAVTSYARSKWPGAKVVLYGQSMGGAAVLRAVALEGVRPDAIAIESTFDRMVSAVGARFRRMGLPAWPGAPLLVFWGGLRIGANGFEHDPVAYAASVDCPSLVLQSGQDPNVSSTQARSIYDNLGGWKLYTEAPAARHCTLLASNRERWSAGVRALLSQL